MRILVTAFLVLAICVAASPVQAASTTLDASMGAYVPNADYAYMAGNWQDFIAFENWHTVNSGQRVFLKWNLDWANLGTIEGATIQINRNGFSQEYGIPEGSHLEIALVTEYWDMTPGESMSPPKYWTSGPSTGTPIIVTAPGGDAVFGADVTSLLQTWQANPQAYFGISMHATDSEGGMVDINDPWGGGGITGDLVLTTAVPEPATMALLALGAVGLLKRRKSA